MDRNKNVSRMSTFVLTFLTFVRKTENVVAVSSKDDFVG